MTDNNFMVAFRNGLEYWNVDGRVSSADDSSTSYINLVNFSPATQDIARLKCVSKRLPVQKLV